MAERRLGLIMHGVTGRMGYNQHLVRSILAIRDSVAPPTLNLENPSRESPIDRVAKVAQEAPHMQLRVLPARLQHGLSMLETNHVEMIAGYYPEPAPNLRAPAA